MIHTMIICKNIDKKNVYAIINVGYTAKYYFYLHIIYTHTDDRANAQR